MRAYIIHSPKACPERAPVVEALQEELERAFPNAGVHVLTGHEPSACDPEHARTWCSGGSPQAISRLLKHVDALVGAAAYCGRSVILEDDVLVVNAAALVAAVEGQGTVQLADSASAYCLDSGMAANILAYVRMTPRIADFHARWKDALKMVGTGSRNVHACSDGSTMGRHTPSVRSGKALADDHVGSASTLLETERLLKTYPMHPHASLLHAAKLKEQGDVDAALKVCIEALDRFQNKPDGAGDTPIVRFTIGLFSRDLCLGDLRSPRPPGMSGLQSVVSSQSAESVPRRAER